MPRIRFRSFAWHRAASSTIARRGLEECEADRELKTLVRDCLTAEPRERPRDASVVADRLARYQENVETRLQESELERAAQSVRLVEERKRRRASLTFAAALITLIGLAGGGGVWMQTVRSQEAEQLAAANETLAEQEAQRADQEQEAKQEVSTASLRREHQPGSGRTQKFQPNARRRVAG